MDFDKAGYEAPGDWARIRDLIPDKTEADRKALAKWRAGGSTKADALALLAEHGIDPWPYDPAAACNRRTS